MQNLAARRHLRQPIKLRRSCCVSAVQSRWLGRLHTAIGRWSPASWN